jgi:uncharacterized GH25 family protein
MMPPIKNAVIAGAMTAALVFGSAAAAHDFWVQPTRFWVAPGATVPTSLQVGHGKDRVRWDSDIRRITAFRSIGPDGVKDHIPELRIGAMGQDHPVKFGPPGAYILYLTTDHAQSELPSLRFNDYAKTEGLTVALAERERTKTSDKPGRELYTRRAKVLVQVGPASATPDPKITRPIGLSLEIVPEVNPYAASAGDSLPVRILYEGKPLAGATVKLNNLDFDYRPIETQMSDGAGRAVFKMPKTGTWQLNVIWSKSIKDSKADFETTFSSLTFGFPPGGRPG